MKDFVALDFETATRELYSACALGTVRVSAGKIVEKHYWLFQPPGNEIWNNTIRVHGITPTMTRELDTFEAIREQVFRHLDGRHWVAHNAVFDTAVLRETFAYYGLTPPEPASVTCTCTLMGNQSLEKCCAHFGISMLQHHDALSDALACAEVYLKYDGQRRVVHRTSLSRSAFSIGSDERHRLSRAALLPPDLEAVADKSTPFYGRKVVITGSLDRFPVRDELACRLRELGACMQSSISGQTNLVVVGDGAGWKKMETVERLQDEGRDIRTMEPAELYAVLDGLER